MNPIVKRSLNISVALVVVVGIFVFALPQFADYGDVWDTITAMTSLEVGVIVALAAFNLWTYLPLLTSVMPGLKQRQAFVVNNSSTAISNTAPAGAAFGIGMTYSMYHSWGFSNTAISLSVIVSGIWNTFVKLGLPIVALVFLAFAGEASSALIIASLVGVAVLAVAVLMFAAILRSAELAERVGERAAKIVGPILRIAKRPAPTGWGTKAADFRESVIELVERRWQRITLATVVSHLTLGAVLLVTLRNVGVSESDVDWATVLAAFAFGRLVTAIPITPGGLGVIELGYVAALSVGVDDLTSTRIVAAVLLFRAITYLPPIIIGAFTYLFWRTNSSWRRPPAGDEPSDPGTEPELAQA